MQHVEFIDKDHFEYNYNRTWAEGEIADYIDFCWETDFDRLLDAHPEGFSDVLLPNIGYTYIINLNTPFVMELEHEAHQVKNDGFIPRHHYVTCHHSKGNHLFGIKFKVCPIVFQKDIDFSEYTEYIYPLAYLIDRDVVQKIKNANSFNERVSVVFNYYEQLVEANKGKLGYVTIVTDIIRDCQQQKQYNLSIEELSHKYNISNRTLQRHFRATTSYSSKQALQTMRIREAAKSLSLTPENFSHQAFGYYDYSHFYKHLQQFAGKKYSALFQPLISQAKTTT
jgi:AraC-like DNA-binding protein